MGRKLNQHEIMAIRSDQGRRYGRERKPSLAPIFKGEKRRHVIDDVMDILRDWRFSAFEHEGACWHGIRQSLCLQGYSWGRSDFEAFQIVAEGLRTLGATRPTWWQGQREYCQYENVRSECVHCCGSIPDDRRDKGGVYYCSDDCRRFSALRHREKMERQVSMSEHLAALAVKSVKLRDSRRRHCQHCQALFVPTRQGARDQQHCSLKCAKAAITVHHPKPCDQCGEMFKPRSANGHVKRFCSMQCAGRYRAEHVAEYRQQPEKSCTVCRSIFRPTAITGKDVYCSRTCRSVARNLRRRAVKTTNVIYLTVEIFDQVFDRAA